MKPLLYFLDTNILVKWMEELTSVPVGGGSSRGFRTFCEANPYPVYISDLAWVELLSVVLQKRIDVSQDFNHMHRWVRDRETLVQQLELTIENTPSLHWYRWKQERSLFLAAEVVVRDPALIDERTFKWMRDGALHRARQVGADTSILEQKLLDGMDSVLLVYLNELAHENPESQVVLLTMDYPFWRIFQRVRSHHRSWFAQNTLALFTNSSATVRCLACWHDNPISVLCETGMPCRNPNHSPHRLELVRTQKMAHPGSPAKWRD